MVASFTKLVKLAVVRLMAQLMQQCIDSLDTVGLGERVAIGQMSHNGWLGLHLDVIFKPAAQLEEDVEGSEV